MIIFFLFKNRDIDSECDCGYVYMPYQLCLQPPTASENVAVALALRGPAQSWLSASHPWLVQPFHLQKVSQRICSLQAGEATK